MSLIHDALKKAQGTESAPVGSGLASFQEPIEEKKGIPKRTLILAVVVALAVVFFIYMKFVPTEGKKTSVPTGSLPTASLTQTAAPDDVTKLKKSSIDAYNAGDMDSAWASLQTASQLNASDPEVWNNLGLVARKRGDVVKAREAYSKALELKAEYPEALNNMAVLEMQSGNTSKAKELLEKALAIAPANPEANFHMALLYEQAGDKKKAVDFYKNFIKVGSGLASSTIDSVRDHIMEIDTQ